MFGKIGIRRKRVIRCVLLALCFVCLLCLAGCQSSDRKEVYFNSSGIDRATVTYNASTNSTKVSYAVAVENNTIYDIQETSITFGLYKDGVRIGQKSYSYDRVIKHGDDYEGNFNFSEDGEVDAVRFEGWTPKFRSFWGTYKIWLIVLISVTSVAVLVYIIIMIVQDFDLSDVIEDWEVIVSILVICGGGSVFGFVNSWVSGLLVLGAFVVFAVVVSVAHFIKEAV